MPLVPIALATGWSALVLWLVGVPLNPMSATLGALVIAISTEFWVCCRRASARSGGRHPTGGGDGAHLRVDRRRRARLRRHGDRRLRGADASDIAMLRDFGLVTVIDLSVSLLGVLAVLPAVLDARRAPRPDPAPPRGRAVAA